MRTSAISNGFNAANYFHECTLHSQHLYTVGLCVPPLQVYCNMDLDGGGWTMVWKHSYMEVLTLTTAMYYFSQHYRECSDMEAGWCNIPNKGHLQPTHMMSVVQSVSIPTSAHVSALVLVSICFLLFHLPCIQL